MVKDHYEILFKLMVDKLTARIQVLNKHEIF